MKNILRAVFALALLGSGCIKTAAADDGQCLVLPKPDPKYDVLQNESGRMARALIFALSVAGANDHGMSTVELRKAVVARVGSMTALAQLLRLSLSEQERELSDAIAMDIVRSTLKSAEERQVERDLNATPLPKE